MKSANELRKIALEKQEIDYKHHYDDTIRRIDEIIEWRAKAGCTWLFLNWSKRAYIHNDDVFWFITKKMFKDMKKYYKERGFKINRGLFDKDIYIEW